MEQLIEKLKALRDRLPIPKFESTYIPTEEEWETILSMAEENEAILNDHSRLMAIVLEQDEENKRLREALEEIKKGEGAYDFDPLKHASNTIRDMIEIAKQALTDHSVDTNDKMEGGNDATN